MEIKPKRRKRSPLKDTPLRHAGQSLNQFISEQFEDAYGYIVAAVTGVVLAGLEWLRYYRNDTWHPWIFTTVALLTIIYCIRKCRRILLSIRSARLGRDGEKIVSEFLDQLRPLGYATLHDVVGGNFNVDHVLIGPSGVFAIETKTLSKSGGSEEKVHFDGANVFIHARSIDPNPVDQAKANARWIRELLKDSTGKEFVVTPVVHYPLTHPLIQFGRLKSNLPAVICIWRWISRGHPPFKCRDGHRQVPSRLSLVQPGLQFFQRLLLSHSHLTDGIVNGGRECDEAFR